MFLRAFDVPGAQARRQADDRVAPAEHPGGEDGGFLDADDRDVGEFARRGQTGIAERADDRGVAAGGVFRQRVEHGVRGDRGFGTVLDVLRAERGGDRDDVGAGRGEAAGFLGHRVGHRLGDVGVDEEEFHRPVRIRSTSCFTVGMKPFE